MFKREVITTSQAKLPNYASIQLSETSESIIETSPSFKKLKILINSTIGYSEHSEEFSKIRRFDHSVYAAKQAHLLPSAKLTDYEKMCLELALLLHDVGHALGSHTIDKLYHAMSENKNTATPDISAYGYSKHDYHEYHTSKLVASTEYKTLFSNDQLLSDVLAILAFEDIRSQADKDKDYQFKIRPSLSGDQIKMLYTLKDWLDRLSYLELEYLNCRDFSDQDKQNAIAAFERFRSSIEIKNNTAVIRQKRRPPEAMLITQYDADIDESPAVEIIRLREQLFNRSVYHPLSAAYDEYIMRGTRVHDATYSSVRRALSESPMSIFSPEVYRTLTHQSRYCLSRELVPLVTIDHYFLTSRGQLAFQPYGACDFRQFTQLICAENKYLASFGELLLNDRISKELSRPTELYVLKVKRPTKTFTYDTIDDSGIIKPMTQRVNDTNNFSVIVALKLLRQQQVPALIELSKDIVESEFKKRGWVYGELNFQHLYNPNIFTEK
jgi:hypothetical protein